MAGADARSCFMGIVMAWLTPTTLENYVDSRLLAMLSSDVNTQEPPVADSGVINELLDAAKEEIESAARIGKRYTPPFDADEVTAWLRQIQAALSVWMLYNRRSQTPNETWAAAYDGAMDRLAALRRGTEIPGMIDETADNVEAMLPESVFLEDTEKEDRDLSADNSGFFRKTW